MDEIKNDELHWDWNCIRSTHIYSISSNVSSTFGFCIKIYFFWRFCASQLRLVNKMTNRWTKEFVVPFVNCIFRNCLAIFKKLIFAKLMLMLMERTWITWKICEMTQIRINSHLNGEKSFVFKVLYWFPAVKCIWRRERPSWDQPTPWRFSDSPTAALYYLKKGFLLSRK